MSKDDLIEVFEMKSQKELIALYLISKAFNETELELISQKVQDSQTKNLILKYL